MLLLKPFKWALSLFVTVLLLWVIFYVPIGRRTLWQHMTRISRTQEAQDLGTDVRNMGEQVAQKVRNEWGSTTTHAADGGSARSGTRTGRTRTP